MISSYCLLGVNLCAADLEMAFLRQEIALDGRQSVRGSLYHSG